MIYANVRHVVADYDRWRPAFDQNEADRQAAGATGVNQIYRDVDDPNTVTVILEWDNAENVHKFMDRPEMMEVMKQAGVVGMPSVRTFMSRV